MNDSTTKPVTKAYPFRTRRQIAERIQTDRDFARQCVEVMVGRQLTKQSGATTRGAMGWGSSDASRLSASVRRIVDGLDTDADWQAVLPILARYTRQLAQHWRDEQLQVQPDLIEVAALYGVGPGASTPSLSTTGPPPTCTRTLLPPPVEADAKPLDVSPLRQESLSSSRHVSTPPVDPLEAIITQYLTVHGRGRAAEIAKRVNLDRTNVLETLHRMHDRGVLTRGGAGRGTHYMLANPREATS